MLSKNVLSFSISKEITLGNLLILYPDRKFLRSMTQANLSIDNCLCSTSRKRVEYISKTSWRCVTKTFSEYGRLMNTKTKARRLHQDKYLLGRLKFYIKDWKNSLEGIHFSIFDWMFNFKSSDYFGFALKNFSLSK